MNRAMAVAGIIAASLVVGLATGLVPPTAQARLFFSGSPAPAGLLLLQNPISGLCPPAPNILNWTTASEVNTAGFNLYRGESADGPFTRINATLIPASREALGGSEYQYQDPDVIAGRTFFYQLEDVEFSGATTRHGPIVITARSSQWLCDNPLAAVGFVVGAVLAIAAGVLIARRSPRRTQPAGAR